MRYPIFSILAAILYIYVISGCSVKEERDGCPCRLFLDMTSIDILDQSPLTLRVISDAGFEFSEVLESDNFCDTCVIDVPKSDLYVVVWSGTAEYLDESGVTIPLDCDCPPVYICSKKICAEGEAVYEQVNLKKNYCILSVEFAEPADVVGLVVRGEVAGFDRAGNPRPGDFRVSSMSDSISDVLSRFYIPRQKQTCLYLDVTESDGMVKTFPLHEYISELGYDWEANDLDDLNVILEYTPVGVSITIKGWEREIIINVVI